MSGMKHRPIRGLVAQQLAEHGGVDLLAIAHALEEEFGVELPRPQLARLGSYSDLLQLVRDVLAAGSATTTEEALASCFVRARIVTGGSDGRVALVRVGWLTPDLVAAVADDVRQSPGGTWLDVSVPDDLSDAELDGLRRWLSGLVSPHVCIDVRRIAEGAVDALRPSATRDRDRLTHGDAAATDGETQARVYGAGTDLAFSTEKQQLQCTQRRRSES
jgi:hypothetical protein